MSEGDAHTSGTTRPNSPAWNLYLALMALADFCRRENVFRELSAARDAHAERMANLVSAGANLNRVLSTEYRVGADDAAYIARILKDADAACKRAREALANGGASAWDESTSPNAAGQRRSIELRAKLTALERALPVLELMPIMPTMRAGEETDVLATLGPWFDWARDELQAVFTAQRDAGEPSAPRDAKVTARDLDAVRPALLAKLHAARQSARENFAAMATDDEPKRTRRACWGVLRLVSMINLELRAPELGRIRSGTVREDLLFRFEGVLPWLAHLDEWMGLTHSTLESAQQSGAWDRLVQASPEVPQLWRGFAGCAPEVAWQFGTRYVLAAARAAIRLGAKCPGQIPPRIDDAAIAHSPLALIELWARETETLRATDAEMELLEARMDRERVVERNTGAERSTLATPGTPDPCTPEALYGTPIGEVREQTIRLLTENHHARTVAVEAFERVAAKHRAHEEYVREGLAKLAQTATVEERMDESSRLRDAAPPDPLTRGAFNYGDSLRPDNPDDVDLAIFWLVGLADCDSPTPILPEPPESEVDAHACWYRRFDGRRLEPFDFSKRIATGLPTDAEVHGRIARNAKRYLGWFKSRVAERTPAPASSLGPPSKPKGLAKGLTGRSAPVTEMELRLALSKTAISEAHGDIEEACAALKRGDHTDGEPVKISIPTLYRHFNRLFKSDEKWGKGILISQQLRNPSDAGISGNRRNRRSKQGDSGRK